MLMSVHVIFCGFILTFIPQNPACLVDMMMVFRFIFIMDAAKTGFNYHIWKNYHPGAIKLFVDRFPDCASQVMASLVVHGVLDIMQSFTTIFTMFISRWMRIAIGYFFPKMAVYVPVLPPVDHRPPEEREQHGESNLVWYNQACIKIEAKFVIWNMVHFDNWWCRHLFFEGHGCSYKPAGFDKVSVSAKKEMVAIRQCYQRIIDEWQTKG